MDTETRRAPPQPGETARRMFALRRERDRMLGADLFSDPAWDMLLDLYAAEEEGRAVAATHLCAASGVPAATAKRWLSLLETAGHVVSDAGVPAERTAIRLSPATRQSMTRYLSGFSVRQDPAEPATG